MPERDDALAVQPFPTGTVFAWKRRAEGAEALIRYARLLLDPERQDEPDEENALRAFEALSGIPVSVEPGLPVALRRAEAAEAALAETRQALAEITATCDGVLERIAEVGEPPAHWSGTQLDAERVRDFARRALAATDTESA